MTRKSEIIFPVDLVQAREALMGQASLVKRSQIEDTFFAAPSGAVARLRRQDTVTRLSCTRAPGNGSHGGSLPSAETVVLDHRACRRLLDLIGFREVERLKLARETWRKWQYVIHLDRVAGMGEFLTLEFEGPIQAPKKAKSQAKKFLKGLGIGGLDMCPAAPYTAPIKDSVPR